MRFDQFALICALWVLFFMHCNAEITSITDLLQLRFKLPDNYINKRVFMTVGWLAISTVAVVIVTYMILEM